MKKILSFLASMIAIAILFTACSKSPDKVLDRKDGKWNAVLTSTEIIDGVVGETDATIATFIFDDDKFTLIDDENDAQVGTWTANKDKVTLIIDGDAIVFDVVKSGKKSQEWETSEKDVYQGMTFEYKINIKLTR